MNESTNCAHDGQLINQCANCIRSSFIANIKQRAIGIELTDHDCAIINEYIFKFDQKYPNMYYAPEIDDDLYASIDDHFEFIAPIIIEFINILIFG